ncbi:MAG: hypothetical protein GY898_17620 [Proteobacteria bacterium]|nr:hypothetical protein [Pseudomonadota bacterium]
MRISSATAGIIPQVIGATANTAAGHDDHAHEGPGRSEESRPGLELSPELDEATRAQVREMAQRDREVRAHEAAHAAAGGALAGAATFTYETGPDGKSYAVAGEVPISLGTGNTPQEKVANARKARAAALAPADPSGADRSIAAKATRIEAEARAEVLQESRDAEKAKTDQAAEAREDEPTGADNTAKLAAAYHQHDGCDFCGPPPRFSITAT